MALLRKLAGDTAEEDEVGSIIDNLNNMLNTKRGYGFFLQDFGLSDYHHLSSCDDIAEMITREIIENIERFEPRLKLIKIEASKENKLSRLSFRIDCVIHNNACSLTLFLDQIRDCFQVRT
jgi:type VI secretion system protein